MSQNYDNQSLIEQALDRQPLMMSPSTRLSEAIATMSKQRASYTLIVEQKKLLGILTERDIVRLAVEEKKLSEITVSAVMTRNLITCTRNSADNIFDLLAHLHQAQIRHLPIIDNEGDLLGVVTGESLRAVLKPTDLLQMGRVADIMTTKVTSASTEMTVFAIAQLMSTQRRSCVVICQLSKEKQLTPVGIITERDIVKFAAIGIDFTQTLAHTVMSSPLLPVYNDATLWEVNQKMQEYNIRRLVVVDRVGYLTGIVTQTNLLQALNPSQMYAAVELLQQTIAEKTQQLQQINSQMQQAQAQLQQVNENLEAQVQARTKELTNANAQLRQALQERTAAFALVRHLNAVLEQRVEERTAQLKQTNQELLKEIRTRHQAEITLNQKNEQLANTLQNLKLAQQELIHSEKMAALGQLIAGIAHEINTPLGAIRSSVENIVDFFTQNLEKLPQFLQKLSPSRTGDFFALLGKSTQQSTILSSKEKRQLKKTLIRQLEDRKLENTEAIADTLVDLGVYDNIEPFLPLLQDPDSRNILTTSYQISSVQKSAQTIVTASERAAKVVFALKAYARDNTSALKVHTNITEGIETILTLYSNLLKQGVELIRNYEPNLPLILCYADELNQVWTNLIHNALQAMKNQGTLKIDVFKRADQICVSITDSGKGITDEIMPKIFEPFFTTKPPGEGSGIGLDIVKKIVDKHGGNIEVESVPGQTTFTIILPL